MSDDMRPYWPGVFKIGERVRVRLSAECREVFANVGLNGPYDVIVDTHIGHLLAEEGRMGTVIESPLTKQTGHNIVVRLDHGIHSGGGTMRAVSYAATELEPLQ